ncbi:recombinase [Allokutzneria albata]|uniref:recombinase n=1 Tax=Allokutzneria albata TaxID=211114 RepID=UPI001E3C9EC1|nr:recombinase [Allokutzneria albata]
MSPKMLAWLDELETDLIDRRTRAATDGWAGEIEGIDMTLTFLRTERDDTQRRLRRRAVDLGMPALIRTVDQQVKPQ